MILGVFAESRPSDGGWSSFVLLHPGRYIVPGILDFLGLVSWTSWDCYLGTPETDITGLSGILGLDWDERGQRGIVFIVFAS